MSEGFSLETPFRDPFKLSELRFGSGPLKVALVAGLHGTELTGVHALNLVAGALRMSRVQGQVVLIPIVNAHGVEQGTKRWPFDDRDINRAFPGDPSGSAVERIACELPQVRVPLSGAELGLARSMQLPMLWRRAGDRLEATGLVGAWRERGVSAMHVVGGRAGTLDVGHARTLAHGLLRLLHHLKVLKHAVADPAEALVDTTRQGVRYHYSDVGGFWVPEVRVGDRVEPGHLLGAVTEVVGGQRVEAVRAERAGIVMSMRAYPVVHARELLVRVAEAIS